MVQKSYGKMRGTRLKLRSHGKQGLTAYLRKFEEGQKVHIDFLPSSPIQHPRFSGKTGTVLARRGRNYIIEIMDGSVRKQLFCRPEHLKLQTMQKAEVKPAIKKAPKQVA